MDGITLCAVQQDLQKRLPGAKIEKIYQPEKDELLLHFRSGEKLLLSANASHARVQLTELIRKNPLEAPMFCMLMRKHLGGAKVLSVSQPDFERTLCLTLQGKDEMGYDTQFSLLAETMGKYSNLILLREDGIIVDAIKHITPSISSLRNVMPGLRYEKPPSQGKRNPLKDGEKEIFLVLEEQSGALDKVIMQNWSGFSPVFAREAALRVSSNNPRCEDLDTEQKTIAAQKLNRFFDMLRQGNFSPQLVVNQYGEAIACFPFVSLEYAPEYQRPCSSIHQALDEFYALRDSGERMKQKSQNLHKFLMRQIERCEKKLAIQQSHLSQNDKIERDKLYGELLTSNAYHIEKGSKSARVQNYYDEKLPEIEIPLDPTKSAIDNAQRFYKRYNKAKAAQEMAGQQIEQIEIELNYLEGQLDNLRKCSTEEELQQIREELIEQRYLRPEKNNKQRKKQKKTETKPLHFLSSDGEDIYVGKNNAQNENLTLKFANADDLWLHTKNIPGSHVILKSTSPSQQSTLEAAQLAAYYSKARNGSQIPVDFTQRRNIKKPKGTPPGFVTYSTNQTAYITVDEGLIKSLRQVE